MNRLASAFVLGYHGCDKDKAEKFLSGTRMLPSRNDHDWLGSGIYFWEANPMRGLEWAIERSNRKGATIKTPYVVGAVIELGECLDLTSSDATYWVRAAYDALVEIRAKAEKPLPKNHANGLRKLDCAVINTLHVIREKQNQTTVQTVRGVFTEGEPIYPTAGFLEKTHIQVAVRDHSCIKGIFRVPDEHLK